MYRWHAPREPKRICVECAAKLAEKELRRKGMSDMTRDEMEKR
jgi:hypothetical protein